VRFVVVRLPMSHDGPQYLILDTERWDVVTLSSSTSRPRRFDKFMDALSASRELNDGT
jgi:hypothetical protein